MTKLNKVFKRIRRSTKTRGKIKSLKSNRLTVFRSNQHTYAQVISYDGSEVLVSASTAEAELRSDTNGNIESAKKVGTLIAKRALEKGLDSVSFDRSGYKFHGRVKALAEAAREEGLKF